MAGALIGALTCARCGAESATTARYCNRCGVLLTAAAPGGVVGTYSGMLSGVFPAGSSTRSAALALDTAPVLTAAVIGVILAFTPVFDPSPMLWFAAFTLLYLLGTTLALASRGTSFGRMLLHLRTVDDLTGDPVTWRRALRQALTFRFFRHTVTAELKRGRDPLDLARPAIAATVLRVDHSQRGGTTDTDDAAATVFASEAPAESVEIVLDTGERHEVTGSVLIGRVPENGDGEEHNLFAWPDLSRTLSKTHGLLEWSGTVLWVTDRTSTNGSALVSPAGERQPLVPGLRGAAAVGWTVEFGDRSLEVRPAAKNATSTTNRTTA